MWCVFFFSSARRVGISSPSMTFGEGNGRARHKTVDNRFAEAMSRVASRQSRVYRGEGRRHKSRRGKQIPSPKSKPSSLKFHTFQQSLLKYAKLKGKICSFLTPFTTLCLENGLFLLLPKKKINTNLLGYRRNCLYGSLSVLFFEYQI